MSRKRIGKKKVPTRRGSTTSGAIRCHAILICEAVSRDPSGKPTLYGVFDTILAAGFPALHKAFTLFAKLSGEGHHGITISLVPPTGDVQKLADLRVEMQPESYGIIDMQLAGQVFPSPGPYKFKLETNGNILGEPATIFVKKANQK